ncbi:MAG: glutathione synthase, partial [Cyanobacteria bacterium]|nr:glutathione synthase [Cyanobacteriota bacterium]MDW8202484.1 glutathione synthase [Cyanobacteriota bacterium SKYGB_h_bin112]
GEPQMMSLQVMDGVFMRTDPPVTVPYLYATYILDYIDPTKTWVINSPRGIRAANEKMYALQFTEVIPETIVTADKQVIRAFVEEKGTAVLKPLGGKAGEGILFLQAGDRNLNSLVEISTQQGKVPVMVQVYLPAAKEGDKRIILLNGEPIGAVNRIPTGSEFRGNMAVGGRAARTDISDRERDICAQLAPVLRRDGLVFVGIDVIGGYLTEVNVTSPTGVREIDLLNGTQLGHQVIDWLSHHPPSADT